MKQEPDLPVPKVQSPVPPLNPRYSTVPARKRTPSASRNDDSEWVMETPKRSRSGRVNNTTAVSSVSAPGDIKKIEE